MELTQFVLETCRNDGERKLAETLVKHYTYLLGQKDRHYEEVVETQHSRIVDLLRSQQHDWKTIEELKSDNKLLTKQLESSRSRDCTKLTPEQIKKIRDPARFVRPPQKTNKTAQLKLAQTLRDTARTTLDPGVAARMLTKAEQLCEQVTNAVVPEAKIIDHVNETANKRTKRNFMQKIRDEVAIDDMIRSKKNLPSTISVKLHDKEAFGNCLDKGRIELADSAVTGVEEVEELIEEISSNCAYSSSEFTNSEEENALAEVRQVIRQKTLEKHAIAKRAKLVRHITEKVRAIRDTDMLAMEISRSNPHYTQKQLANALADV